MYCIISIRKSLHDDMLSDLCGVCNFPTTEGYALLGTFCRGNRGLVIKTNDYLVLNRMMEGGARDASVSTAGVEVKMNNFLFSVSHFA